MAAAVPDALAATTDAGGGAGGSLTIEAFDSGWQVGKERTTPNAPIAGSVALGDMIAVTNVGASVHNLSVDGLGIDGDLPAGEPVVVVMPAETAPGAYEFYCDVAGHAAAGMVGTLVVG